VDKRCKRLVIRLWSREEVRVIVLHVGQQAEFWAQTQEHVVIFIGFDHKQVACSGMRVRCQRANLCPEDEGWIHSQSAQHRHQHRRAGGFAMGAGNCDRLVTSSQFRQKFVSFEDGDSHLASGNDFGVIVVHG